MSILYILIGGVCTGKSTYAANFMKENSGFKLIKADDIFSKYESDENSQLDAQSEIITSLEECCINGDNIVFDGMNIISKNRKIYILKAKKYGYHIIGVDFGPYNLDFLKHRKELDNSHDWATASMIDEEIYQLPTLQEGFDKIINMRVY